MICQMSVIICILSYTDDTKLYRHICTREDQNTLQNDIHRVTDWASEWLLKLNVDKCCRISFTANVNSLCNTQYYIEDSRACHELIQEAQLSPRDRAMRRVNWNRANCHATVQKLLIRQVLTESMVRSWRFSRRQCVIDNVHSTMTRGSPLSQVS